MHEGKILSVFVDESGRFQYPDKDSRFYIVGMVFHDQSMEISRAVEEFKRSLLSLGLDSEAFVFHAGPLIRREKGYEYCDECPDYPCEDVMEKENRYTSKYPLYESPGENLRVIREHGVWLRPFANFG